MKKFWLLLVLAYQLAAAATAAALPHWQTAQAERLVE
jgi:hypothetical protein